MKIFKKKTNSSKKGCSIRKAKYQINYEYLTEHFLTFCHNYNMSQGIGNFHKEISNKLNKLKYLKIF